MVDFLGDVEDLGIEFDADDFVDQKKLKENPDAQEFI